MPSALGRGIQQALDNLDLGQQIPLNDKIPVEPEAFYKDFGYLVHPLTRKPVTTLTPYQLDVWNALLKCKRVLAVKSQKIGLSTSQLLTDFQLAILPSSHPLSCRGFDQLVIAQTKDHAKEHLRTLRKLVIDSKRYNPWLIDRPQEIEEYGEHSLRTLLRSEQTKTSVLFFRNPENEQQPSRIIALGLDNPGAIQSWKNVKGIHISDPTASISDITESLNFAISRLALTLGSIVIETPPSPPMGPIYELWKKYVGITEPKEGQFRVFEIPAIDAVKAGVMTQQWLDSERERDPINFDRLYGAKFSAHFGNVFSNEVIERAIELGKTLEEKYGLRPKLHSEKSQGIDEGFGSSNFGICVVQLIDGILQVIHAEEHERPDINTEVYDAAARIQTWPIQTTQCDAAQPAFIASLKRKIGERVDYENQEKETVKWMKVKPISFSTNHKSMLGNAVILMEKAKIAIHPSFDKLLTALRTAVAQDYSLDKTKTVHDDVLDAFRLALEPYTTGGRRE